MTIATDIARHLCVCPGHVGHKYFCADCVQTATRVLAAARSAGYTLAEPVSAAPSETGPALIYITDDGTRYQLDQMPLPDGYAGNVVEGIPSRDGNILLALWRTFAGDNPMSVWNR